MLGFGVEGSGLITVYYRVSTITAMLIVAYIALIHRTVVCLGPQNLEPQSWSIPES